jgi:5-bromo-4-chloroindolyl phosphate hydrolysis protein
MKSFLNISGAISGIVGGFTLLLFFLFLQSTLLVSAIIGIAGFTGTYLLIYAFKPKTELSFGLGSGVTPEDLDRILKEGDKKVQLLQSYSSQVSDATVKQKLAQIINVIKDILNNFKRDPKGVKYAKQFLSYYLDTTIYIVKKYAELSAQNLHTPEIQSTLLKAENMLNSIEKAFEMQKAKLLSDDVMQLDVEIETLEKTFNAEGLN